jgi:hypothetical protein
MLKQCLECGDELHGRIDKKFCSDACRNAYNNKSRSGSGSSLIRRVNGILTKNRNIMVSMNTRGKTSVHRSALVKKGFDFYYYTNHYVTRKGRVYYFCYDQGYLQLENDFFMLVSRSGEI